MRVHYSGGEYASFQGGYYSQLPNTNFFPVSTSDTIPNFGEWRLYTYTSSIESDARIHRAYIDTTLVSEVTLHVSVYPNDIMHDFNASYRKINIGYRDGANNLYFHGAMSDFLYYSRAISDEEVKQIFEHRNQEEDLGVKEAK